MKGGDYCLNVRGALVSWHVSLSVFWRVFGKRNQKNDTGEYVPCSVGRNKISLRVFSIYKLESLTTYIVLNNKLSCVSQ